MYNELVNFMLNGVQLSHLQSMQILHFPLQVDVRFSKQPHWCTLLKKKKSKEKSLHSRYYQLVFMGVGSARAVVCLAWILGIKVGGLLEEYDVLLSTEPFLWPQA